MSDFFNRLWYQKNHFCYFFTPFSALYRLAISVRSFSYCIGLKKIYRAPVPVIVVGNLTVGGTGKTPLVITLAQFLTTQGYRPGIVSRGYGGKRNTPTLLVTADSDPTIAGDEPVLIARHSQCPLIVANRRVAAVKQLLDQHQCDIIISDDGLQHTALARDIEIVVIDGQRRFGNGFCLPAGPLREPLQRLKQVDFKVVRGGEVNADEYAMRFIPGNIYNLVDPSLILHPDNYPLVHAVAGIGNPQPFFNQLRQLGFRIIEHPFPDHHAYQTSDLNFGDDLPVIMTEKDAVKCLRFKDPRHWCLSITGECASMLTALLATLQKLSISRRK